MHWPALGTVSHISHSISPRQMGVKIQAASCWTDLDSPSSQSSPGKRLRKPIAIDITSETYY